MVTIAVDEEVWRYLQVRKEPGDSMNDVLRHELGFDAQVVQADTDIEAVLDEWEPETEADTKRARQETMRAAEWLRDRDDRATKSEFVDALADASGLHVDTWWGRCVQPGLRELAEQGVVEYRSGYHDYRWLVAKLF